MLVPLMNAQCEWSGKIFATIGALVLKAVGEHVPVQALAIFQSFSTNPAQEGPYIGVRLDVLSEFALLLECFSTFVTDMFAKARLSLRLVHSHLVLKRNFRVGQVKILFVNS